MFGIEKTEDLKRAISEQLSAATEKVSNATVALKVDLEKKAESAKESFDDFSVAGKVRDASFNAVNIVSEIDQHLLEKHSPYEVATFRVTTTIGVILGVSLDIQFTKTTGAKAISQERSSYLVVTNPSTGQTIKVPRVQIGNKKQVKAKDPSTGEVLVVDVATGAVIASGK